MFVYILACIANFEPVWSRENWPNKKIKFLVLHLLYFQSSTNKEGFKETTKAQR